MSLQWSYKSCAAHTSSTQQQRKSIQSAKFQGVHSRLVSPVWCAAKCVIWSQSPYCFWVIVLNNGKSDIDLWSYKCHHFIIYSCWTFVPNFVIIRVWSFGLKPNPCFVRSQKCSTFNQQNWMIRMDVQLENIMRSESNQYREYCGITTFFYFCLFWLI